MNDGASGDRLTIGGSFAGLAGSRLALDVDFTAGTADVLATNLATGTTVIEATVIGQAQAGFASAGILLVDAGAGTQAGAFTLAGNSGTSNAYVTSGLFFDAANFDFLLVNTPNQPVFETAVFGEMFAELWHRSADAIAAQLDASRDGQSGASAGPIERGRLGGWVQLVGAERERVALQTFGTGVFDVSYEQNFEGIQAGFDHQSGPVMFGVSFGVGQSEAQFEASLNTLEMQTRNLGAYVQFQSGSFFLNALAKADWIEAETTPGPGLGSSFDATAIGVRASGGFRFALGGLWAEPAVSLSWTRIDVSDITSGGARITFDDVTSLRGAAGLRVGGEFSVGAGTLAPFVGIHAIQELGEPGGNDFTFGSTLRLDQEDPGTFGQASLGLTYRAGMLEAFVRGEYDFGGNIDGRGARAGVRLRF
jgi:outer membrane autotransporter protein